MIFCQLWGQITHKMTYKSGQKDFLSKIYKLFYTLKQFKHSQICNLESMTTQFQKLYTVWSKILGSWTTLKEHRFYTMHFETKFFSELQSRICTQYMNAKYICKKWTIGHFSASLFKNRPKIGLLGHFFALKTPK